MDSPGSRPKPGNELEGTEYTYNYTVVGKGTESLLLGDGTCLSESLASPGRLALRTAQARGEALKSGNPGQRFLSWTSTPACGEADDENGGGRGRGELA